MNLPHLPGHDCDTCPARAQLDQMGINLDSFDHLIALAGNPIRVSLQFLMR